MRGAPRQSGDARRVRKAKAAFAAEGGGGVEDGRGELAGSEGVQGAETGVEFGGGDAAFAVEPAEKMGGGTLSFERIAFEAGGNQVAIGVAPRLGAGHDVVEALDARVGAAQTIKTMPAFAEVYGLAQGAGLEEVQLFQVDRRVQAGGGGRVCGAAYGDCAGAKAANLIGQAHVNDVATFAATDEAERTDANKPANRFTHGAA